MTDMTVAEAHAVLEANYGCPVKPVSEVCKAIESWIRVIRANHLDDDSDRSLHEIAKAYDQVWISLDLQTRKSNLLWRMLYANEPLRREKCPEHKGRWMGIAWSSDECKCIGPDGSITGWLPNDD